MLDNRSEFKFQISTVVVLLLKVFNKVNWKQSLFMTVLVETLEKACSFVSAFLF